MKVGGLAEVILYVADMERAVRFYRDVLGIPVLYPRCECYREESWVVLETGACRLCLHGGGQGRMGEDAAKIVFEVADLPRAREELLRRGLALSEIRSPAPGVLVCDGRDPDGNPFSLESADPEPRASQS